MKFLVSIHDVMPETLTDVERIVDELTTAGWAPATLLVVPGRDWGREPLRRLRYLAECGHPLAGHGWRHSVPGMRNLRHRLHSILISRRAAEHYALDALGVETLVRRCHGWFDRQGLPPPTLYVPPAWALGPVRPEGVARAGFRYLETLRGIHDLESGHRIDIPLLGFEADTAFRAWFLGRFNAISLRRAGQSGIIRLAIHPGDFELRLASQLRAIVNGTPAATAIDSLRPQSAVS